MAWLCSVPCCGAWIFLLTAGHPTFSLLPVGTSHVKRLKPNSWSLLKTFLPAFLTSVSNSATLSFVWTKNLFDDCFNALSCLSQLLAFCPCGRIHPLPSSSTRAPRSAPSSWIATGSFLTGCCQHLPCLFCLSYPAGSRVRVFCLQCE